VRRRRNAGEPGFRWFSREEVIFTADHPLEIRKGNNISKPAAFASKKFDNMLIGSRNVPAPNRAVRPYVVIGPIGPRASFKPRRATRKPDRIQKRQKVSLPGATIAIIPAMNTTIDAAGRLVIPKEIRRAAGLAANMPLELRCRDGVVEIEPAPVPVTLERRGRLLVAVVRRAPGMSSVDTLTTGTVERTRRRIRRG
jgi:AbrB family looped-hinge helix DNA binding protein